MSETVIEKLDRMLSELSGIAAIETAGFEALEEQIGEADESGDVAEQAALLIAMRRAECRLDAMSDAQASMHALRATLFRAGA